MGAPVLTATERTVLRAAIDCVHPADDLGPGGVELGLEDYLLAALEGPLGRHLPVYRTFLAELDLVARDEEGSSFPDLEQAVRVDLLRRTTGGPPVPGGASALETGMTLLVEHVYEGLFGDPVYGGNLGGAGWRLVGYPGPRTEVPAAHQVLDLGLPTVGSSIYDNPVFVWEENGHG